MATKTETQGDGADRQFPNHAAEIAHVLATVCRACGNDLDECGFCSTCEAEGVDHGEGGSYYSSERMDEARRIGH